MSTQDTHRKHRKTAVCVQKSTMSYFTSDNKLNLHHVCNFYVINVVTSAQQFRSGMPVAASLQWSHVYVVFGATGDLFNPV